MSALYGFYGHPHWRLFLDWFDPTGYLEGHEDLDLAGFRPSQPERLLYHFINQGFLERRIYSPQLARCFNVEYYAPQVGPKAARQSWYELQQHWLYEGIFEGLAPSEVTDAALGSEFQVFNMGRVASQAIVQALLEAGARNIIHTHSDYEYATSYAGSILTFSQILQVKQIASRRPAPRIFSGVRDPMEWAVSAIWRSAKVGDLTLPRSGEELVARLRQTLGTALHWFVHGYFMGLDVFQHPFDAEAGFGTIEHGRTRLFLYRMEALPRLERELCAFTELPALPLTTLDASRGTADRDHVERLLASIRLPEELVHEIYDSALVRHFFTERERERLRDRWLRVSQQVAS
jgi:hypothetical protein